MDDYRAAADFDPHSRSPVIPAKAGIHRVADAIGTRAERDMPTRPH